MRIGDVAAATGVAPATLRSWERRYGVLRPLRSPGGHREYQPSDVARVRTLTALIDSGTRVSDAVRRLTAATHADHAVLVDGLLTAVWDAADAFNELATRAVIREATDVLGVPGVLDGLCVPLLRRLGAEWREAPRNIAREHFVSTMLRSHLVDLLPATHGPPLCLAVCPEGERHDLGLLMAAVALATSGWNTVVLGADTPWPSTEALIAETAPALVIVASVQRRPAMRFLDRWSQTPRCAIVAGGAGFKPQDRQQLSGHVHTGPYHLLPQVAARNSE